MFWRYDKEQLLSFRPAAPDTIRRSVSKTGYTSGGRVGDVFGLLVRCQLPCSHRPLPDLGHMQIVRPCHSPVLSLVYKIATVASLNARSIRHKSASIQDIIKQHNVDIFTIVEAWH